MNNKDMTKGFLKKCNKRNKMYTRRRMLKKQSDIKVVKVNGRIYIVNKQK